MGCPEPVSNLRGLEYLTGLTGLNVKGTVDDLAPLAELPLDTLTLATDADLSGLAQLPPLKELFLSAPLVTNLEFLTKQGELTTLALDVARDSDLAPLVTLKDLNGLSLAVDDTTDLSILPNLSVPRLRLELAGNIPTFTLPPSVTAFTLGGSLASLEGLPLSPNVTWLGLNGMEHLDSLAGIEALPSLVTVFSGPPRLDDASALHALPFLQHVDFDHTELASLAQLAGLHSLTTLTISNAKLTSLAGLTDLPALTSLDVSQNQLTSLTGIEKLSALKTLDASTNRLTNIDAVTGIHLATVKLSGNALTSVQALREVEARATVTLDENGIKDFSPLPDAVDLSARRQTLRYPQATVAKSFDFGIRDAAGRPLCPTASGSARCTKGSIVYPLSGTYRLALNADSPARVISTSFTHIAGPFRVFTSTKLTLRSPAAQVGRDLIMQGGVFTPTPEGRTRSWRRDGKVISGAHAARYRVSPADVGHRITGCVTARADGFDSTTVCTKSSKVTIKGTLKSPARPKITGTAKVGKVLTAKPGTWTKGSTLSYQWQRNGTSIAGATSKTYTLTKSDKGDKIRVRVTGKTAGYTTKKIWSLAVSSR